MPRSVRGSPASSTSRPCCGATLRLRFPLPADLGYLSLPPLVFAGLLLLARSRIRGLPKTMWVDGLTAGLAAGAVSAAVVFKPILHALGGSHAAIATNLSY
jgi:hypothetical protein